MTTCLSHNIRVIGVKGSSDDADVAVKEIFEDSDFKRKERICSINSINWSLFLHLVFCFCLWVERQNVKTNWNDLMDGGEGCN